MSSLYIHIPYCQTRCGYCDFHSSTSLEDKEFYVQALCEELRQRQTFLPKTPLETLYFGGGTPSLLTATQMEHLFSAVRHYFQFSEMVEITLEANPDDLSEKTLKHLRRLGVNRLSIGVQSFDDEDLRRMGRRHSASEALRAVFNAQSVGFENISCDLMFGLPKQTLGNWAKNINQLLKLNVQHISCYNLSYEKGTAFYQKKQHGELQELDDELCAEMYKMLIEKAKQYNFQHYETSNFAKKGCFSRHNSNYWRRKIYLGLGAGAHSFDGKKRRWNVADNRKYTKGIMTGSPHFEEETLSRNEAYNEFIMTGLRTMWGCDLTDLQHEFGEGKRQFCMEAARPFLAVDQLLITNDIMHLSPDAVFVSDAIMAALMSVE